MKNEKHSIYTVDFRLYCLNFNDLWQTVSFLGGLSEWVMYMVLFGCFIAIMEFFSSSDLRTWIVEIKQTSFKQGELSTR
jgi:hypothetical protein